MEFCKLSNFLLMDPWTQAVLNTMQVFQEHISGSVPTCNGWVLRQVCIDSIMRKLPDPIARGCTVLYFPQPNMCAPAVPHPHQDLLLWESLCLGPLCAARTEEFTMNRSSSAHIWRLGSPGSRCQQMAQVFLIQHNMAEGVTR